MKILVADIGGTNIRFAIVNNGKMGTVTKYKNADFAHPFDAFDLYLSDCPTPPTHMILGIAGPIDYNVAKLTNRDWSFSAKEFEKRYHLTQCQLVNDFVLKGYGALALTKNDFVALTDNKMIKDSPKCVIGPGTGLGVCFLTHTNNQWTAHPSEAGHTDIAPSNTAEQKIIKHLCPKGNNLSAEELLSGRGLVALYHAVCAINHQPALTSIPEGVLELALENNKTALEAYKHFFNFLGTFCGNMAITMKCLGGIYITSSILRHEKIEKMFLKSTFKKVFINRGKMQQLASDMPILYIKRSKLAFLGLKKLAQDIEQIQKRKISA